MSEEIFQSEHAMRFGPRVYTKEQAEFIAETVEKRSPLPEEPLPIDDLDDNVL
jgi:hypothetical protein